MAFKSNVMLNGYSQCLDIRGIFFYKEININWYSSTDSTRTYIM